MGQTSLKPSALLINGRIPIEWAPVWAMMGARAAIALFLCCDSMDVLIGQSSCLGARPVALFARAYQEGTACPPTAAELLTLNNWIESEFKAIPCLVKFWTGDVSLADCKAEFTKSGTLNVSTKFRAIHDWQHIVLSADDSFNGEFSTWWNNNAPDSIQWILFSEIVLQAAAAIHTGKFPAQKLVKYSDFI
jgi:hypothetical protein